MPHLVRIVVKQDGAVQAAEPLGQGFAGVPEVAASLHMGCWRRQRVIPVQHQLWPAEQPRAWPRSRLQQRDDGLDGPHGRGCEDAEPEVLLYIMTF